MRTKSNRISLSTRSAWTAQLFILPFYLGFLLFFLSPLIQSIRMSFSSVFIEKSGYTFKSVGFENYRTAFFDDPTFNNNLTNVFAKMAWQVPVILVLSLFLAIILNQKFRGRVLVRAIFFLPVIFASGMALSMINGDAVASSAVAGSVVSGGEISQSTALRDVLVNAGFGSDFIDIATQIANNLFGMVWRSGIQMIIFLAGLQSIPATLYEASAIEGATAWENFWKITLPMLTPTILINLVYTIIDTFTDSSNEIMMQVVANTSLPAKMGLGSAFSWIYFIFIGIILLIVLFIFTRITKKVA